jgi:agmatinase
MRTFGGIDAGFAEFDTSAILIQSLPYDGTSTWGKGADRAFGAILDASENMELYDIETDSEVFRKGIHIMPDIHLADTPEEVMLQCYEAARKMIASGKFPVFIGGEHSVSIGIMRAFREEYGNLTVLQLDAHTDLRPEYLGTPYNHACALHETSRNSNLIQVGIRSMDTVELPFMNRNKVYLASEIYGNEDWMDDSIMKMTNPVYITLDLDVLDPSIMPSTGTPEPGGMLWDQVIRYLDRVFRARNVVGFDIVEFAPKDNISHPAFLVSKLLYKMLSFKFYGNDQ